MLSKEFIEELNSRWFPHLTDSALDRLINLLETNSPLLIHGSFTGAVPMGCLASHAGWHHPLTEHLHDEAGICWLTWVAGLNPATSKVIREWDSLAATDWETREQLALLLRLERQARQRKIALPPPASPMIPEAPAPVTGLPV